MRWELLLYILVRFWVLKKDKTKTGINNIPNWSHYSPRTLSLSFSFFNYGFRIDKDIYLGYNKREV